MEEGIVIAFGISLGLIYIFKSVRQAGEDMESFDEFSLAEKFKKPEGWKVGKLPADMNPVRRKVQVKRTAQVS
jgi:hypothetical protein